MSTRPRQAQRRPEVCELGLEEGIDDELLTLSTPNSDRWYVRLQISGQSVRFMLDSGATVNLVPAAVVRSLGRDSDIRPTAKVLRMFDQTQLNTTGVVALTVVHP